VILGDALRPARARDNGSRGEMDERELQRVGLSGYVVALRDRLDALDLGDNLRGCLVIFARAVRISDDDVDALGDRGPHQPLQRALMIGWRIAAG
jgi:hypothetical protein